MKKIFSFFLVFVMFLASGCNIEPQKSQTATSSVDTPYSNSAPKIIFLSFAELKLINEALETMSAEEFEKYMSEENPALSLSGMHNYKKAKILIDELKETTILLLNNELSFNSKFSFYYERNEVHIFSDLSEKKRVACYAFTPQRETSKEYGMSLNENLVFLNETQKDGVTLKVYDSLYEDRGFHIETEIDNTYITLWINKKQNIEEFESDLARLEFIKIGDLLNKVSTETTTAEGSSTIADNTTIPEESTVAE